MLRAAFVSQYIGKGAIMKRKGIVWTILGFLILVAIFVFYFFTAVRDLISLGNAKKIESSLTEIHEDGISVAFPNTSVHMALTMPGDVAYSDFSSAASISPIAVTSSSNTC